MSFKVGDLVEIVGSANTSEDARGWIGEIATVVEVFEFGGEEACHLSDFDRGHGWYSNSLRLYRPPQDLATWESLAPIWKPKALERV